MSHSIHRAERRREPRKPLVTAASVAVDGYQVLARIVDVSQHGLCIAMFRNLALGTHADISFSLTHHGRRTQVILQAKVVNSELTTSGCYRIGLELGELTPDQQLAIGEFLRT